MIEVWEEKSKTSSEDVRGEASQGDGSDKDEQNMDFDEMSEENKICRLCGKVFKNDQALKAHGRNCKGEKDEKEEIGSEKDILELKKELMTEIKTLKGERKRLEKEKSTFREEMKGELERLEGKRNPADTVKKEAQEKSSLSKSGVIVLEEDEVDEAEEEESTDREEIEKIEEELEQIEPEVSVIGKGISRKDLEDLSRDLEAIESELNTKVDFVALSRMSEDYKSSIEQINESITKMNRKIDAVVREIEETDKKFGSAQNIFREMKKLDEKTSEILEEIGFGESLNVAKIPPNILENVYESTIEDIINELHNNFGSHDAEKIITSTLEDVRTRTSGSELFYFDGRMMRTRNLAKAIQSKLISAKQVQTTYAELLRKLMEYLPGYKAKNFRAVIKLKSQEYAVDKTTQLLDTFDAIKMDIDHLKNMIGSVSNRQNTIEMEIDRVIRSKIEKEDIEQIRSQIEEIKLKQNDFDDVLKRIDEGQEAQKAEKEVLLGEIKSISQKITELEKPLSPEKKKGKDKSSRQKESKKEDKGKKGEKAEYELSEDEKKILLKVPKSGFTLLRIKKEILDEMKEEKIEDCLRSLMDKGVMTTVKRGRHTIYIKNKANGGEK